LEKTYEKCLKRELQLRGVPVRAQVDLPVVYKGYDLGCEYVMDLVVDDRLVVELKTVDRLEPIHQAQLLTYMKLSGLRTGLLINFHVAILRDGIKRMVL
jgi:GxxExxY protein